MVLGWGAVETAWHMAVCKTLGPVGTTQLLLSLQGLTLGSEQDPAIMPQGRSSEP